MLCDVGYRPLILFIMVGILEKVNRIDCVLANEKSMWRKERKIEEVLINRRKGL